MRNLLKSLQSKWSKLALLLSLSGLCGTGYSYAETPEHFAHRFADFKFEFHAEVQDPAVFLTTKKGDCDDFATVADDALTREGYTTHLIAVRMPGETHVVLYVDEAHGYLDYNYRAAKNPCLPSDGNLQHIAAQVAKSFNLPWLAVYEFNFFKREKHLVTDIVKNDNVNTTGPRAMLATVGARHKQK